MNRSRVDSSGRGPTAASQRTLVALPGTEEGGGRKAQELAELPLLTPEYVMLSPEPYETPTEVLPRLYLAGEIEGHCDRRKNLALGISLVVRCNAKRGTPMYMVYCSRQQANSHNSPSSEGAVAAGKSVTEVDGKNSNNSGGSTNTGGGGGGTLGSREETEWERDKLRRELLAAAGGERGEDDEYLAGSLDGPHQHRHDHHGEGIQGEGKERSSTRAIKSTGSCNEATASESREREEKEKCGEELTEDHPTHHVVDKSAFYQVLGSMCVWPGAHKADGTPSEMLEHLQEATLLVFNICADDDPNFDLSPYFFETSQLLETVLMQKQGGALVHCMAGISRSATIVTAFVMKHCLCERDEALALVRSHRRWAEPNIGFMNQLTLWEMCGYVRLDGRDSISAVAENLNRCSTVMAHERYSSFFSSLLTSGSVDLDRSLFLSLSSSVAARALEIANAATRLQQAGAGGRSHGSKKVVKKDSTINSSTLAVATAELPPLASAKTEQESAHPERKRSRNLIEERAERELLERRADGDEGRSLAALGVGQNQVKDELRAPPLPLSLFPTPAHIGIGANPGTGLIPKDIRWLCLNEFKERIRQEDYLDCPKLYHRWCELTLPFANPLAAVPPPSASRTSSFGITPVVGSILATGSVPAAAAWGMDSTGSGLVGYDVFPFSFQAAAYRVFLEVDAENLELLASRDDSDSMQLGLFDPGPLLEYCSTLSYHLGATVASIACQWQRGDPADRSNPFLQQPLSLLTFPFAFPVLPAIVARVRRLPPLIASGCRSDDMSAGANNSKLLPPVSHETVVVALLAELLKTRANPKKWAPTSPLNPYESKCICSVCEAAGRTTEDCGAWTKEIAAALTRSSSFASSRRPLFDVLELKVFLLLILLQHPTAFRLAAAENRCDAYSSALADEGGGNNAYDGGEDEEESFYVEMAARTRTSAGGGGDIGVSFQEAAAVITRVNRLLRRAVESGDTPDDEAAVFNALSALLRLSVRLASPPGVPVGQQNSRFGDESERNGGNGGAAVGVGDGVQSTAGGVAERKRAREVSAEHTESSTGGTCSSRGTSPPLPPPLRTHTGPLSSAGGVGPTEEPYPAMPVTTVGQLPSCLPDRYCCGVDDDADAVSPSSLSSSSPLLASSPCGGGGGDAVGNGGKKKERHPLRHRLQSLSDEDRVLVALYAYMETALVAAGVAPANRSSVVAARNEEVGAALELIHQCFAEMYGSSYKTCGPPTAAQQQKDYNSCCRHDDADERTAGTGIAAVRGGAPFPGIPTHVDCLWRALDRTVQQQE